MDAVLFAGGEGSRTRPAVASPQPKHTTRIGHRPLIWHVIQTLIAGGADKIIVSLNGARPEQTILSITEHEFAVPICYTHSNNAVSNGPVYDLLNVQQFVTRDKPFITFFADAFYVAPLQLRTAPAPHIWTMELSPGADASQYGQVVAVGNQVTTIAEKPEREISRLIQTGAIKLPYEAFAIAQKLCRGKDPGVHFGHLTAEFVKTGAMTCTSLPTDSFIDCGRLSDIQKADRIAQEMYGSD